MKYLYTRTLVATLVLLSLTSCQKELYFPEEKPTSQFTLTTSGVTYNLKIDTHSFELGDTASLIINASSPQISITLNSKSANHTNGIGAYYLKCCTNDVFDRTSGTQKHWEIDHMSGGLQNGTIKIIRKDEKGLEGTYSVYGNDYDVSRTAKKEFKGSFVIVY